MEFLRLLPPGNAVAPLENFVMEQVGPSLDGVILSTAVFQAERRACPERVEGISSLIDVERQPNCTTTEHLKIELLTKRERYE
ncbi:MAG: hypothetical protein WCF22_02980 [Candidatus Sulfotelmatobacter sp.]